MSNLRIFGIILGLCVLIFTFLKYRGPKWKRSNFLTLSLFSLFLIIICINPDFVNYARDLLSLEEYLYGRFLALLILSNIFLILFTIYIKAKQSIAIFQIDSLVRHVALSNFTKDVETNKTIKPIMVLIPAYNEEENLNELLPDIPEQINGIDLGVLVIDDGSEDNTTGVVVSNNCLVASNPVNRGGGAALRLGYDILKDTDCRICVTMDADGQHKPGEIKNLVRPILNDENDFIIGSRILGHREKDNIFRLIGVYVFGFIISILLGKKITDPSSNFRAFKMEALITVILYEDQYHTSELIIEAVKKGLRLGEAPITILKRKYGISKKGKDFIYGFHFAKTIIKTWWRR